MHREWKAVLTLHNHILVLAEVAEDEPLINDWMNFVDWFHGAAGRLVWQMQNGLLFAVEGEGDLLDILYGILGVKVHCALQWLSASVRILLIKLYLDE